jgi:diguanylate cyclase (GGDEF)-like protein
LSVPRRFGDALVAVGLAAGAPVGLLLLRAVRDGRFDPSWAAGELASDAWTYGYLLLATTAAFAAFGFILGRQADRLSLLSRTDALTGLGNRRYFEERLEAELARARRHDLPLSLLAIDLDGLKLLNDRLGHRAGDLALRRVAAAIRRESRASDVATRWGGDEFMILAPETGPEDARSLSERVRRLVAEEAADNGLGRITISVGVASLAPAGGMEDPQGLVRVADAALLAAKRGGRDQVVIG